MERMRKLTILLSKKLTKHYGENESLVKALDGVDVAVKKGEFVAIVGTSGSGKSTLLNMLGGLDNPTDGKIEVNGVELSKMTADQLTVFRRKQIGFVFQNYNLVPILNVYENIVLPMQLDGQKIDKAFVKEIIALLHLEYKVKDLPGKLSGGQQQRVALARALASKPAIILADEPTGNLDSHTTDEVMTLLRECNRKFGQTIVMITHNDQLAASCDRIIRIEDGRIAGEAQSPLLMAQGV